MTIISARKKKNQTPDIFIFSTVLLCFSETENEFFKRRHRHDMRVATVAHCSIPTPTTGPFFRSQNRKCSESTQFSQYLHLTVDFSLTQGTAPSSWAYPKVYKISQVMILSLHLKADQPVFCGHYTFLQLHLSISTPHPRPSTCGRNNIYVRTHLQNPWDVCIHQTIGRVMYPECSNILGLSAGKYQA